MKRAFPRPIFEFGAASLARLKLQAVPDADVRKFAADVLASYASTYVVSQKVVDETLRMADYIAAAARSYVRTALPKLPADQVDGQALRLANGFAWHVETTGADGSELPFWRRLFKGSAFQPDEPYDLTRSMGRFGAYLIQVSSQGLKVPEGYWFGRK